MVKKGFSRSKKFNKKREQKPCWFEKSKVKRRYSRIVEGRAEGTSSNRREKEKKNRGYCSSPSLGPLPASPCCSIPSPRCTAASQPAKPASAASGPIFRRPTVVRSVDPSLFPCLTLLVTVAPPRSSRRHSSPSSVVDSTREATLRPRRPALPLLGGPASTAPRFACSSTLLPRHRQIPTATAGPPRDATATPSLQPAVTHELVTTPSPPSFQRAPLACPQSPVAQRPCLRHYCCSAPPASALSRRSRTRARSAALRSRHQQPTSPLSSRFC